MGDVDIDSTPRQGRIVSHTPLYVWAYPCEHSGRAVQPVVEVLGIAGRNTLNDRFDHIRAVGRVINTIAGQVVGTGAGGDHLDKRISADFDQERFVQEAFRQEEIVVVVDGDGQNRSVGRDRKSTRLNSSHTVISYAVFCLKKKKNKNTMTLSVRADGHETICS